ATELYFNRNRYYSPQVGRFISKDPIGFEGGNNLWTYAGNNPLQFVDPDGKNAAAIIALLAGLGYLSQWEVDQWNRYVEEKESEILSNAIEKKAKEIVKNQSDPCDPQLIKAQQALKDLQGSLSLDQGEIYRLPGDGPDWTKLKGNQGWRDSNGRIWQKDQLHKDHWDVSDGRGRKIMEIDYSGRRIWPGGPKNKNK
ncbi:MAG: RHS repeat-associated core domain-containing protein, partial [Candidatus Riflebacteria bacterium]|nr:RHS repeat-associated core domain-containing protein [Candidatus Riflebacteria bacterium]